MIVTETDDWWLRTDDGRRNIDDGQVCLKHKPVNTGRCSNGGLVLAHRLRHWSKPPLVTRLVFSRNSLWTYQICTTPWTNVCWWATVQVSFLFGTLCRYTPSWHDRDWELMSQGIYFFNIIHANNCYIKILLCIIFSQLCIKLLRYTRQIILCEAEISLKEHVVQLWLPLWLQHTHLKN